LGTELLAFEGVGYAYPNGARLSERFPALRKNAVENLTFSVCEGDAIALLGGNGSGKSTLLQLADGLLVPERGEIRWRGAPMDRSRAGLARLRSEVGLLFQDPDDQLFAGTLFQDVAFGPLNQGLGRNAVRARVEEALQLVGLSDYEELPPHVFSQGMRKRAALAGVLAMRPRLLLLDEPTAGLDPESEERLLDVLDRLVASGTSVILSTHDLELAGQWAREALVLAQGRLAACGEVGGILSDHEILSGSGLRRARCGRKAGR
jgi:cobalt/nickel transport system ATP-binding protein